MRRGNILAGGAFTAALLSLAAFIVVLLVVGGTIYYALSAGMERNIEDQLAGDVQLFREIYSRDGQQALTDAVAQLETPAVAGSRAGGLFDDSGRRLAGNLNVAPDFDGFATRDFTQLLPQPSGRYLLYAQRIAPDAPLRIVLAHNIAALQQSERLLVIALLLAGLAVTTASIFAGYAVSRRVFGKLETVSGTLEAVSHGEMDRRVPIAPANDQIDRIAARINEHLDRLSALSDTTKSTINAIAHDLRSPINRVSIKIQQAMEAAGDDAGMQDRLGDIAAELENVVGVFEAIMRISRIEAASGDVGFTTGSTAELFTEMEETFGSVLEAAGQRLTVEQGAGHSIYGDMRMLKQMLANLIQNASHHCPPGTEVALGAAAMPGGGVSISVSDDGPGIPAELRADVLKPFHRLDSSRSTPGAGLGLALVNAIAIRHRAILELGDNRPGLIATIRFPPSSKITKM